MGVGKYFGSDVFEAALDSVEDLATGVGLDEGYSGFVLKDLLHLRKLSKKGLCVLVHFESPLSIGPTGKIAYVISAGNRLAWELVLTNFSGWFGVVFVSTTTNDWRDDKSGE